MTYRIDLPLYLIALIASTLVVSCKSKSETSSSTSSAPTEESSGRHQHGAVPGAGESSKVVLHTQADCPTGSSCFLCDPSKRTPGRLWCKEHNRYEDRCWGWHLC